MDQNKYVVSNFQCYFATCFFRTVRRISAVEISIFCLTEQSHNFIKTIIPQVNVNDNQTEAELVEEVTEESHPPSDHIDIPSTSGYFISNTISQDALQPSTTTYTENPTRVDSPPDCDSLEVISAAAATLSNFLSENERKKTDIDPESTDDSGVCTENTSLDRSPSLEDEKKCLPRKRSRYQKKQNCDKTPEDDCSSVGSSDTSSFNSNCADDEEIALAMQAAEFANRNEVRAKYG